MRILLLSDIHANSVALDAVLGAAGSVDETWCLGDLLGYGPDPNGVLDRLRALPNLTCLAGNHDLAAATGQDLDYFNPEAQKALDWQRRQLSPENAAYLGTLRPNAEPAPDVYIAHASPTDNSWGYILTNQAAQRALQSIPQRILIVGHTHYQVVFQPQKGNPSVVDHIPHTVGQEMPILGRAVLNPGSVGQPRDRDRRAAFAIFDPQSCVFTPMRVEYAVNDVMRQILAIKELPSRAANRLEKGE